MKIKEKHPRLPEKVITNFSNDMSKIDKIFLHILQTKQYIQNDILYAESDTRIHMTSIKTELKQYAKI